MTRIADETLMAFADGELNGTQALPVRLALGRDPALRSRLQSMRILDEQVRAAFLPELDVPDRFSELLRDEPAVPVVPLSRVRKSFDIGKWLPAGTAIAAGVAGLVAGGLLTSGGTARLQRIDDAVSMAGAMQSIMTQAPSGSPAAAGGLNITPVLSFITGSGGLCRELSAHDNQAAARIVACKEQGGDGWRIEAFARVPRDEVSSSYRTAGSRQNPVIEAAYKRLGVSQTLDAESESRAIADNWSDF
jgi:hypothetical protein